MPDPLGTSPDDGERSVLGIPREGSNKLVPSLHEFPAVKIATGEGEIADKHEHSFLRVDQLAEKERCNDRSQATSDIPVYSVGSGAAAIACWKEVDAKELDTETSYPAEIVQGKHWLPTLCGAAMIAASLTCMYSRTNFVADIASRSDQIGQIGVETIWNGLILALRRVTFASSEPDLQTVKGDAIPVSNAQAAIGVPPRQGPYKDWQTLDDSMKELRALREAFPEARELASQFRKAEQDASAALQVSLDKIALLETKLQLVRRYVEQAASSHSRERSRRLGSSIKSDLLDILDSGPDRTARQGFAGSR